MTGDIGRRMFQIMEEKHVKSKDMCALLNIKENTLSSWKARNKDPESKDIFAICEYLGVSCEYLLTGNDRRPVMVTISPEDREWLDLLRSLPQEVKAKCRAELEGYLKYSFVEAKENLKQAK